MLQANHWRAVVHPCRRLTRGYNGRMKVPFHGAFAVAITLPLISVSIPAAAKTVAVFDFELIDTSLEGQMNGPRSDERARIEHLGEQLRQRLAQTAAYQVLDIAPVEAEARASNLQACGGCDAVLAKRIGADFSITGTVQKVSNLILNVNLYVRDIESGKMVASMSADFRGNTDESWTRALDWLIRNRLLAPNFGVP